MTGAIVCTIIGLLTVWLCFGAVGVAVTLAVSAGAVLRDRVAA